MEYYSIPFVSDRSSTIALRQSTAGADSGVQIAAVVAYRALSISTDRTKRSGFARSRKLEPNARLCVM